MECESGMQKDLAALVAQRTVVWGKVEQTGTTLELGQHMTVGVQLHPWEEKRSCVVSRKEADLDFRRGSLEYLLGQKVPLVLLDAGPVLTGSRRLAQQQLKEALLPDLRAGRTLDGRVLNLVPFGACVEVRGVVGVLKHSDYSEDYSEVGETRQVGDRLKVYCRELTPEGRIYWRTVRPYRRPLRPAWNFAQGSSVTGTVFSIRSFPAGMGIFVRIAPGLDALCTLPSNVEVEQGVRVALRITKVVPRGELALPPRIRGRILRVLR